MRFIDLFAGIGGIRKGFELACQERNIITECVFTSEIKPYAISVLKQNHPNEEITGDITKVCPSDIPDFDVLLAGFPCQPFSSAGVRLGFEDTRGTLFFDVARILKEKQPLGFVLENVEGLVNHDKENPKDKIGRTLQTILNTLNEIGYHTTWKLLDASLFGIPQERKRVYIVGTRIATPNLENFEVVTRTLDAILEQGLPTQNSKFTKAVLSHYSIEEVIGKCFKDKRGGKNNIHSWDIEIKGKITKKEKELIERILTERRKKQWAEQYGIDWMDGMPLTLQMISTFFNDKDLEKKLERLTKLGYLTKEHPKRKVGSKRVQDESLPIGYNIVAGKMSFEINEVLNPNGFAPTLVATDMDRIFVADNGGLRPLSLREGLRLFGYPDDYSFDVDIKDGYDLLGNTVVVPVIKAVAGRMLDVII